MNGNFKPVKSFHSKWRLMNNLKWMLPMTFLFLSFISVHAQDYKMGIGIRISSNDAIVNHSLSFKYFFRTKTSVEALLSLPDPVALGLLVEQHEPLKNQAFKWFYGGGLYVAFTGTYVGLQGVLGLDYRVPSLPLTFSIDWKPEINLAKEFTFEPAAIGLSARFVFN